LTNKPMGSLAVLDSHERQCGPGRARPAACNPKARGTRGSGQATVFRSEDAQRRLVGFGYRAEFNRLGLDVSFLNLQPEGNDGSYYGGARTQPPPHRS
jgi:hypothetical protein